MATTVNAKIFSHREKADATFNVKYVIYHTGSGKIIDSPHFISKRQLTKDFEIKDQFVLKCLDEQLEDYRVLVSSVGPRLNFLPASNFVISCATIIKISIFHNRLSVGWPLGTGG